MLGSFCPVFTPHKIMEVDVETVENIVENFDRIFDSGDEVDLADIELERIINEREPILDAQYTDIVSWKFESYY